MALEGTHIRFALGLEKTLGVTNEQHYLVGTVYPDSRYITKIPRALTHPENLTLQNAGKDSFKLGWYVHILCDKIGREIYQDWFPGILAQSELDEDNSPWLASTMIKVFQDLHDITQFPIQQYMDHLSYMSTPNGEDVALITHYNAIIQTMYATGEPLTLDHEENFWRLMTIGETRANKVHCMCEQYQNNQDIAQLVPKLYDELLTRALKQIL